MYEDVLFLFRGIEAVRLTENSCDDYHFSRSRAIRRKKNNVVTVTRVKNSKNEIGKCFKNYRLLDSAEEIRNTKSTSE